MTLSTYSFTRRRFFTLASAACLTGVVAPAQAFHWQGIALGAKAQIILDHPDAAAITAASRAEISRLEGIFSLYRSDSEISRLNANGRLDAPSFELLECLSIARTVHQLTEGRFDPSVQRLWQTIAMATAQKQQPNEADLAQAQATIGFDKIDFDPAKIILAQGQALTLNGIAQGYIADRIAALMARSGVRDVLIDTGEISALGNATGQTGWPVRIQGENQPRQLNNRALATSAINGTVISTGDTGLGHILDPRNGAFVTRGASQISVSAKTAAFADGLSTGLCLTQSKSEALSLVKDVKGAKLESFIL